MTDPQMPTLTGWFIIATAILWLAFEIYVIAAKKETISSAMYRFAKQNPSFPFIIGYLFGHWFW